MYPSLTITVVQNPHRATGNREWSSNDRTRPTGHWEPGVGRLVLPMQLTGWITGGPRWIDRHLVRLTPVCHAARRRATRFAGWTGIPTVSAVAGATAGRLLLDTGLLRHVGLIVLCQVRLLSETLAT